MELLFIALLMLIMAFALGSGFPVAFSLPGAAIITIGLAAATGYIFAGDVDAYFLSGGPSQWLSAGVTNLRGVYWEVERDTLIAIPLFIFMGIMLQRSKIAEDLLVTMAQLFGGIPGGLGISVVFVGALLAATTGIVGATVVAMGLISLPTMLRNNYSPALASGTIAASGTLGQIIPPSIVLIILADQLSSAADQASTLRKGLHKQATGELSMPSIFDVTSTSAGEMFLGALIPGLLLVGLYMLFILGFAILKPQAAPPVPYEGAKNRQFWVNVFLTLVPPLALIFLVLGSILMGVATVNQAGAIGAAGALIMAGYRLPTERRRAFLPALLVLIALGGIAFALANYEMNIKAINTPDDAVGIQIGLASVTLLLIALVWSGIRTLRIDRTLQGVMAETAKTTSLVFMILLGAAMLTAAFRAFGGEDLVREFLNSLPGGFWTQFVIVMAVIFILGFFLDFIEIAVVVVPIVAPILLSDPEANITAVWLGVMIGLNIQTSFLTPPFGFALFYLRGVAPAVVKTIHMYKGVVAFISLQLIALAIVGLFPPLVNYLPYRISFLSETSPPPRNPALQYCLSNYIHDALANDGGATLAAITRAKQLDLSSLPKDLEKKVTNSFGEAGTAIDALNTLFAARAAVAAATDGYKPILRQVRDIEKDIRSVETEQKALKLQLARLHDPAAIERRADLERQVARLDEEKAALAKTIPADWADANKRFSQLVKAEMQAQRLFQRSADNSYEPVQNVLKILAANASYMAMADDLNGLRSILDAGDYNRAETATGDVVQRFGAIEGSNDVRTLLNRSARALRERSRNPEKAIDAYEKAVVAYTEQAAWRSAAATALQSDLNAYETATRGSLGVRQQQRLSRDQALFLAFCAADHRDISVNF